MPLIVLEGVDGSGKTTFAEALIDRWHGDTLLLHKSKPDARPIMQQYTNDLRSVYRPQDPDQLVVCDRWHVGERIYGPLYRGQSRLTPGMARYIELMLDSFGASRHVLSSSLNILRKRLEERGEDFLQPEHLAMVVDQYVEYAYDNGSWLLHSVVPDVDETLEAVKASWRKSQPMLSIKDGLYLGPPEPSTIFVTTLRGNVHPLMDTVAAHNIKDIGWYRAETSIALIHGMRVLKEPNVITLDKTARRMCEILGIHPLGPNDDIASLIYRKKDKK